MSTSEVPEVYRGPTGAQLLATFAGEDPAARERDELHQAWLAFGRHNWLWQLCHRKPRPTGRAGGRETGEGPALRFDHSLPSPDLHVPRSPR